MRGKLTRQAQASGKSLRDYLISLFDAHGSQSAVADATGCNQSSISNAIARSGLRIKTVLVERDVRNG